MKKVLLSVLATASLMLGGQNSVSAQVEQGSVIIDPYYGYPNFGKKFADSFVGDSVDNVDIIGLGPCGLRAEYLVSDNFGVGFDFIYNSFGVEVTYDDYDQNNVLQTYKDNVKMQRFRVQFRMNYHFAQTDALDAYVGFGAGTNIRKYSINSDNPNYTEPESLSSALIPVSLRIALGTRYYFTDNIGINAELGLGGPVLSGGISIKF